MKHPKFLTVCLVIIFILIFPTAIFAEKQDETFYLTQVHITTQWQIQKLKLMGITIIHQAPDFVTLQVSEEQLETLAKKQYMPYHTVPFSPQRAAALASGAIISIDDADTDGDGLTDTEESWWNTDPEKPDTDSDSFTDGDEVAKVRLILAGEATTTQFKHIFPPFLTLPPELDIDMDYLPDQAERFAIGTSANSESTDGDKYDDGQELFGRSPIDYGQWGGDMPSSVLSPGNNVFVAAYPNIHVEARSDTIRIEILEEITTAHGIIEEQTTGIETTVTRGSSTTTGSAETHTYSEWNEAHNTQADEIIIGPAPPSDPENRNSQNEKYVEGHTLGASLYNYELDPEISPIGMDDLMDNPANTGKHVSVNIAGQKDVSVQSKLYNDEIIPIDNEVLNRLLGFGALGIAAESGNIKAKPPEPAAYDPAGEVDYGVFLATVPESGSLLDDSLALTGTLSDLGVPFVSTVVNLGQNAIEAIKSDALGILVTNGGRPVYMQTYNSWTARGGTPFDVILYRINDYGLELRSAKNPLSAAANILFPSQMHRGYPDFYMGIPSKSKSAYIDFLEFFVEQQLPFKDLAKESISEAAYSILKEMDASVGGLLDPSGKPTELGQKVLEYIEQMGVQSPSAAEDEYDISKTIVHGQETVQGTGEETSYQTSIQRTTWEERSETEIHLFTTAEEWSTATTIHPEHAANFDFTIVIENIGTDTATVIEDIRFNIYVGDNPFTPEYENFPPITYPPINEPGFSLGNFYPGREGEFGVSVPLTLDQLRAIDEGAKVQLYTAYYSYGEDELIFNNAWHADVMFEIDDGVSDDDETIDRFLIPVIGEETYIDAFNRAHIRVKDTEDRDNDGNTEEYRVISIEVNNGMIIAIDGLPVSESGSKEPPYAWWNVYLTESADAAYFINATAQPGNRVLFVYSQDSDGDGYSDREEFHLGTDRYDADSHPEPILIAAKHYEQSGDDVTGTIKLQNIGNYEAYCAEARLFALDDSVSIDNAVIGGDGHVRPGEVVMPTTDTFKFHINRDPYTDPVMMVRYTDPQGLHTFITPILLVDLSEDISGRADEVFRDVKFDADTIGQYVHSANNQVFVKYHNPLADIIQNAALTVIHQSIFGDVFQEDSRTVDVLPGYNLFIFSFTPEAYITDTGIGKDIVVLAAIEDYQGVLIDSDVQAVMIVSSNPSPYSAYLEMTDLADGALDFGTSTQGQPLSKSFTVFNTGLSDIEVLGGLPNRDFTMTQIPRKIQPGDSSKVEIGVNTPAFSGDWSDQITIATSDPTQSTVTIPVTGTTEPPVEIVSVYEIENSPWKKLIYISGDHSAGEVLEFDHPITLDLETEPLYVYQDSQLVGQGKIISPDDYIISKTASQDRIQLILPQDVVQGLSLEIEFGKAMEVVKKGE